MDFRRTILRFARLIHLNVRIADDARIAPDASALQQVASGESDMELKSSAFSDGDAVPRRFTCEGEDLSPPLQWNDAPAGTRSFVILCDDLDAPAGTWDHWAAYNIPVERTALPDGAGRPGQAGLMQAINDFGRLGYGGPCPPRSHGPHHYRFRLLALSIDYLPVRKTPSCPDVEREARKHLIEEAILTGSYER
jgi:Raf kinase inhibitor-like YbhB/YbcL family protein